MSECVHEAPKPLELVSFTPPPAHLRRKRMADFVKEGEKKGRYHLPQSLVSPSCVGYRTRVSLTEQEAKEAVQLLALTRPTGFVPGAKLASEQERFEENALGVITARQSTNFRGQQSIILDGDMSQRAAPLLRKLEGLEAPVLDHAIHTHVVLSRPYRTPFTTLLSFIGHKPVASLATVPWRLVKKRLSDYIELPTVAYLAHLHIGVLADQLERAVIIASNGTRKAQIWLQPFVDDWQVRNRATIRALEKLAGVSDEMRKQGWRIAFVAQVGQVPTDEQPQIQASTYRKIGANMMAFRSERILPGINQESSASPEYHIRQDMDVPERMTEMAGRAAYNAFTHWTGVPRDQAKELLLLERIDSLKPEGQVRLGQVRAQLDLITDMLIDNIPKWVDIPLRGMLSKNAERGRKAFALTGQRIYMGGLDKADVKAAGIGWMHAVRVVGASSSRAALYAELMGVLNVPDDCDMLAGICLMAGPMNQNDIGQVFYGQRDLMQPSFPNKNPTSLLFWTLKAKTVTDPIGNEEQLMNASRKGALVDLRPGPHEVVHICTASGLQPMRKQGARVNEERAFADLDNFVRSPNGDEIPGNRGRKWA